MFRRLSIDGVIADVQTKITQLNTLAQRHSDSAYVHAETIKLHAQRHDEEVANSRRARDIAGKFAALIG